MNEPLSLVITENDKDKAQSLVRAFEKYNFDVTVCNKNGSELLNLYEIDKFDVIIMDAVLSHIDAIGVVSRINDLNPVNHPLVIVLSDFESPYLQRMFTNLGVDYYFRKPVEDSVVVQRVVQIVSWRGFGHRLVVGDSSADIAAYLQDIGMVPTNIGFKYLVEAIMICLDNPFAVHYITRDVYPVIAERNSANNSAVERAMRYSLNALWQNYSNDIELYLQFGFKFKKRPTVSHFISFVADRFRYKISDLTQLR